MYAILIEAKEDLKIGMMSTNCYIVAAVMLANKLRGKYGGHDAIIIALRGFGFIIRFSIRMDEKCFKDVGKNYTNRTEEVVKKVYSNAKISSGKESDLDIPSPEEEIQPDIIIQGHWN